MRDDIYDYYGRGWGLVLLWLGLLVPIAAWVLHQQISYLLAYWVCGGGSSAVLHLWALAMLGVALLGGYLSFKSWRDSGKGWTDDGGSVQDWARFMALGGLMAAALFGLAIIAQWLPVFYVDPCAR
jgi:hypothetical protein